MLWNQSKMTENAEKNEIELYAGQAINHVLKILIFW